MFANVDNCKNSMAKEKETIEIDEQVTAPDMAMEEPVAEEVVTTEEVETTETPIENEGGESLRTFVETTYGKTFESDADFEAFVKENGWELIYISAATGKNLDLLVSTVATRLRELPPLTVFESEITEEDLAAEDPMQTTVRRENDTFFVEGKWLIDLMGRINPDSYESLSYFQRVLQKNGVIALLEEKGCTDGHTVNIYDFEFEFVK